MHSFRLLSTGQVAVAFEYCERGDLFKHIKATSCDAGVLWHFFGHVVRAYDPSLIPLITYAQVRAVEHLHALGIVHRDIKPENVVVSTDMTAKLCDFGMAGAQGSVMLFGSGTGPYMAPEIIGRPKVHNTLSRSEVKKSCHVHSGHGAGG